MANVSSQFSCDEAGFCDALASYGLVVCSAAPVGLKMHVIEFAKTYDTTKATAEEVADDIALDISQHATDTRVVVERFTFTMTSPTSAFMEAHVLMHHATPTK